MPDVDPESWGAAIWRYTVHPVADALGVADGVVVAGVGVVFVIWLFIGRRRRGNPG